MTRRNLNPQVFFEKLSESHRPSHAFRGTTRAQFDAWKKKTLPLVLATLGKAPSRVPMNPELQYEWHEDGLVKQRWVIDVQPGLSAVVLVFRPDNLKRGEKRPAILCCHGHGAPGKHGPMGVLHEGSPHNPAQAYGLQMAKRGFVTYSLDWLGFGERDSRQKPHLYRGLDGRDPCNVHYLCATMLGTTMLAMNCHDGSRATDFVCEQSFVDASNLGVMGCSLGGTMTTWMALTDKRFKAIDIMCYAGPFHDIAYRTYNVCGSQVTPGEYALVDLADLQGLLAPRPMLVEIGLYDACFEADYTLVNQRQLERIYKAAGAAIDLDLFPGPHGWGGNKSEAFFTKHLGLQR